MRLKLISGSNPKMKTVSEECVDLKRSIKVGKKMLLFLNAYPYGVGLSAVQVGILKQIFVIRYKGLNEIVINPEILRKSKSKMSAIEGCLSFPNQTRSINRPVNITAKYYNGKETVTKEFSGMLARIFQHEYDHLNGIVCIK